MQKNKKKQDSSLDYVTDSKYFKEFVNRLQLCTKLHEPLGNTLSNIFSMRYIGNKTHGDLAEVGITEFINRFMYNYECKHVGKELFRSKDHEEDIAIKDLSWEKDEYIPVSLKAYGIGPLQLSTDKGYVLFKYIEHFNCNDIQDEAILDQIKEKINNTTLFNLLPLIYEEKEDENDGQERKYNNRCNILLFNTEKMNKDLSRIVYVGASQEFDFNSGQIKTQTNKKQRKHPVFIFLNKENKYICEVRYGGATANALQRGLWSNTSERGIMYFNALFKDWIKYDKREELIQLIQRALNSSTEGHKLASEVLNKDLIKIQRSDIIKNEKFTI